MMWESREVRIDLAKNILATPQYKVRCKSLYRPNAAACNTKILVCAIRFFKKRLVCAGVCKTRTGYLRMADADGKMRIEKCGWKKKTRRAKKVRRKKKNEKCG